MKTIKIIFLLVSIVIIFPHQGKTQSRVSEENIPQKIQQTFQQLIETSIQEKVYLHLDKTTYLAGDKIWFKAYVADASYHIPNFISKFVYVELIDRQDSLFKRVKIRELDSVFYGNINLPTDIPAGDYCIRAYTRWMQNNDEAFFFKKNIKIINTSQEVNVQAIPLLEGEQIRTTLTLADNDGRPYSNKRLKINLLHQGRYQRSITDRTDEKGNLTLNYSLQDSIDQLRLTFPYDQPFPYSGTIHLPNVSQDIDIQFFPEGGNLLSAVSQSIAFKAIDANGHSIDVEGHIYDSAHRKITDFQSQYRGMGTLSLTPDPNETYYALIKASNGTEKKVNLPHPQEKGLGLAISSRNDSIRVEVKTGTSLPTSASLYVLIQNRGRLIAVFPVQEDFIGELPKANLPAGITHFVLFDADLNVYSQRLYFTPPHTDSDFHLQTEKNRYDRREKVKLRISLKDATQHPKTGNFSIAVTDNNMVPQDSSANHIVSYYLLTSDLKGHIENPAEYFGKAAPYCDLLMLTHGWTRFDIGNVLKKEPLLPRYNIELEQQLQGYITNYGHKRMANAELQVFVPVLKLLGTTKTDQNGNFLLREISFPDSTMFLFRGFKEKGGKMVDIHLQSDTIVPPALYFPTSQPSSATTQEDFFDRFKGSYYFQDGVKIYLLKEVNVIRHRPERSLQKYTGQYTDMADQILGQNELSKFTASSIYQLLMRLPGVYVTGNKVSIRNGGTPLFLVDGFPFDAEFIEGINPEDVDNVGVIKDGARLAFFGGRGSQGVIIINTKHGQFTPKATPGLIRSYPLGYLEADDFYMPKYEDPAVRNLSEIDYRSTIYWNPNVTTGKDGTAEVSFYTADLPATYTITVEGMCKDGEILHRQTHIRRE